MKAFLLGFVYAWQGILSAVKQERNMRFHLCVGGYVLFFSTFYPLSAVEYAVMYLCIGGVLALELVNTAVERFVDKLIQTQNNDARFIKDVAAGAVLVFCISTVFCGFLLFWDTDIILEIIAWMGGSWLRVMLLLGSLVFSIWFVFFFGNKRIKK